MSSVTSSTTGDRRGRAGASSQAPPAPAAHSSRGAPADGAVIRRRLIRLARLMDGTWRVPGTRFRFGLDPILGLVPGLGDAVSAAVSAYIVWEASRLGVTRFTLIRMVVNIVLDALVGSIPVLGDVFDFAFKANQRNLQLLGIDIDR